MGEPSTSRESYWTVTLQSTDPTSPPPEGLLKIDLTIIRTSTQTDSFGNPTEHVSETRVRTLDLPGTMSRTQYSSAMTHWLQLHSALEDDVANSFTDTVIEHVFQNHVSYLHGRLEVHVEAELEFLVFDDVRKGLCEHWIELLRDEYVFLAVPEDEEELGDCSICFGKLVSAGGGEKEKKNYLFESPCRHVFHDECMAEWLRNSDSCPLCRYVVTSEVTDMDMD